MTYDLFIGDRSFSSWSLRGHLMLRRFDLPFREHLLGLYAGTYRDELSDLAPARTLPALRCPDGAILTDTIAMAETLAERHPDLPLYPRAPQARALARSLVAEMHAGFGALREACPMILRHGWDGFAVPDAVRSDLDRIEALWTLARDRHGAGGPWLFGNYSLADAFYAPVAMRIAGYGLPVGKASQQYVDAHLTDPAIIAWRAKGQEVDYDPMPHRIAATQTAWPGPHSER